MLLKTFCICFCISWCQYDYNNNMWSWQKQLLLCGVILILTAVLSLLVLQNYEEEHSAKVEARFFKHSTETKMFELNILLFITTLISACRQVILTWFERVFSHRCCSLVLGLCRVCIRMASITLFDFRIIHIVSTSSSLRSSILVADVVSLLLQEAQASYMLTTKDCTKRKE